MNKKIESIQKSIDIFRKMIEENSSRGPFTGYYELNPRGEYKKEQDAAFKEIRETILNSFTEKYDEKDLEKRDSFIIYLAPGVEELNLNWRRLLDMLKENKKSRGNYFKFLRELEKEHRLDSKKYRATFTTRSLNRFFSDILAEITDDDGIPDIPLITEKQRNKIIENNKEEDELSESNSERDWNKLFEIIKLQREIIELLEQIGEKENSEQKNEELKEEINQLKKEYKQKKQKLDELEKQLNYIIEKK